MEIAQTAGRIHPLMAGAAVSVTLVSLLGAAAILGILPNSHSTTTPSAPPALVAAQPAATVPVASLAPSQPLAAAPLPAKEVAEQKTVVHHHHYVQQRATPARTRTTQVAQAAPSRQYSPPPAYQQQAPVQQPVAQNSPIGIGVGAVVGGYLGSKVGGGNGKTLATIAGAVGGGYVGNEIAKRY